VVIEVRERRTNLLGPPVGMLAEDLLGGPAVVMMLACEVGHLVPGPREPGGAVRVEAQMGGSEEVSSYWRPRLGRGGLDSVGTTRGAGTLSILHSTESGG